MSFEQLAKLIDDRPFRIALKARLTKAKDVYQEKARIDSLGAFGTTVFAWVQIRHNGILRDIFEQYIFSRLPEPYCVTVHELEEVASDQLSSCDPADEFESYFYRFNGHLALRFLLDCQFGQPFRIRQWEWDRASEDFAPTKIWESESRIRLEVIGLHRTTDVLHHADIPTTYFELQCQVSGLVSALALRDADIQVRTVTESAARSWNILSSVFSKSHATTDRPAVSSLISELRRGFWSNCLSRFFASAGKKSDSVVRRMRNALRLIVEADRQRSPAIALSLCFAAIEALVCKKQAGITEELSRNVATLLEPNADNRSKSIRLISDLYNIRSKVLHGESLDDNPAAWIRIRILVVTVLYAVLEWQEFSQRMGDCNESRKEFLAQIEDAQISGKRVVGVPDTLEGVFQVLALPVEEILVWRNDLLSPLTQ